MSKFKVVIFFAVLCFGVWSVAYWIDRQRMDRGNRLEVEDGQERGMIWRGAGKHDTVGMLERINREQVVLIQKALPSVVNITTVQPALAVGDLFDGWEGEEAGKNLDIEEGQRLPRHDGLGAGVILDADGFIVTNAHVVKHALDIRVKLYDGRRVKARVVGIDDLTDIAVIKIDLKGLRAMPVGNSDLLQLGEQVWALGNPYDFNSSVSRGIVSGKNRSPQFTNHYEDFIQSDVVLNPGNSGGPLINSRGEVVGINTAILSGSGAFQGMSFAVPINLAFRIYKEIRDGRRIRRGMLGCHLRPLRADFVDFFKLDRDGGALVVDVMKGSPADVAGLRPMDIIIRYNGQRVDSPGQLRFLVAQTQPGEEAVVDFIRADRHAVKGEVKWPERQVEVILGEMKDSVVNNYDRKSLKPTGRTKENIISKVEVAVMDADFRRRWNIPRHVDGLVVRQVISHTEASEALRLGDVILGIEVQGGEGMRPYTIADFKKLQQDLKPGQGLLFYLYRNHKFEFVVISGD